MTENKLKYLAASIVIASKLSKDSKLNLLNYIQKEASIPQIKALLLDGEIVQLDEQAETIINERFENSILKPKFDKFLNEVAETVLVVYAGMVATAAAAVIGKIAYNTARLAWSKAHRQCLKYKGNTKTICIAKIKKASLEKMVQVLKTKKGECKKSKDPKKCMELVDKKIAKYQKKLSKIVIPTGK